MAADKAVDVTFAGMANYSQNNTGRGTSSARDKKMGNPNGDVVDNTQNYNSQVQGDKTTAPVKPTQHQGTGRGGYLRSMSMPKSLSDTLMNS